MKYLKLKGFYIIPCGTKHADYCIYSGFSVKELNESLCRTLCDEVDPDTNYADNSKAFRTEYAKDDKGIPLSALAAVQQTIRKYYGSGFKFIKITDKL